MKEENVEVSCSQTDRRATDDDRRVGDAVPRRPTGEGRLLSRQPRSQVVAGSNLSVIFDSAHAGAGSY